MNRTCRILGPSLLLAAIAAPSNAGPARNVDPLNFFEGRTESVSIVKVLAGKPYRSRSVGQGRIDSDGALDLRQRVEDEGKAPKIRHWRMRQTAPGRFSGMMSEARGPVVVDEVSGKYRFRFKMKGGLSVEQWLAPHADGQSARSKLTVRRFGIKVGTSEGTIRKIA